MQINDIPTEILLEIFTYLPQPYLLTSLIYVCKKWKELVYAPLLWRSLNLYHSSMFLLAGKEKLDLFLGKVGCHVYRLRTRLPCLYTKIQPELFPNLKCLQLRMYDTDEVEKLRQVLQCVCDLEILKLDVSKHDGLTDVVLACKHLKQIRVFHLRHFFCNHSANLKMMPHVFQVFFQNSKILTHVTVNCGDIFLDLAVKSLHGQNRDLVELNLSRCSGITNVAFEGLLSYRLRTIILDRTFVSDETLKIIADNSSYIRELSISKCKNLTDKGMQYIGQKCRMLQNLKINDFNANDCCTVSNTGLKYIMEGCRDLRILNVNHHPFINADIIVYLSHMCSNISMLKMEKVCSVNDDSLAHLANHCKLLRHVHFSHCPGITGKGVGELIKQCRWLQHAEFESCKNISDLSFIDIFSESMSNTLPEGIVNSSGPVTSPVKHSHIQSLNFRHCQNLTAESIKQISLFCPDLTELRISGCSVGGTDPGLIQTIKNCQNLRTLICAGSEENGETNFTSQSLEAMALNGHNLVHLSFALNHFITVDALQKVLLNCNRIEQIDFGVNEKSSLSVKDIESILTNCNLKNMAFHSYKCISTTGCQIAKRHPYHIKHW